MEDLRELEKCTDDGDPIVWPTCSSPVHVAGWCEYIRPHPDQDFGSYIYRGLSTGFRIGFDRRRLTLRSSARNHPSAAANSAVIRGMGCGQAYLTVGAGDALVKLDLKNTYHIVPVHPQDQHLLGISWEGKSYADRALPFSLHSALKIFSAVADMIAWALHCAGVQHQIHYLDDFLFLGAPATGEARRTLGIALRVLELLGVPVASQKTEGPACCLTFLGILIDTQAFELRLPVGKIQRLILGAFCKYGTRKRCVQRENWSRCWGTCLMQHQSSDRAALSFGSSSAFCVGSKPPAILSIST